MSCPLGSTGIAPLHRYYEAVRPSPAPATALRHTAVTGLSCVRLTSSRRSSCLELARMKLVHGAAAILSALCLPTAALAQGRDASDRSCQRWPLT
jgi:hypothetical protein